MIGYGFVEHVFVDRAMQNLVPQMKPRMSGRILHFACLAGFQPASYLGAYAASKSYRLNFSDALAMELENDGISVSRYSPKHTDTAFFGRADMSEDSKFYAQETRVSAKDVGADAVEKCSVASFLLCVVLTTTPGHF